MQPKQNPLRAPLRQTASALRFTRPELLENRIAPAYAGVLAGSVSTFTGDAANDALIVTAANGLLAHNRFALGDPGFASATDWDSAAPGIQTLAAEPSSTVNIAFGAGTDSLLLGGDQRASLLRAAFTVNNTGADGDTVEINDAAGTAPLILTIASSGVNGSPIATTFAGAAFGKVIVRTGAGNDSMLPTGNIAALTIIEMGAGTDSVFSGATSPLQIDGGEDPDSISGGSSADIIHGGPGNDSIVGRQGSDTLFGDEGVDTIIWNPGDGSDVIDGGTGADQLVFNGANVAEIFTLRAIGTHFSLLRNVGNIIMDVQGVEHLDLSALGGTDSFAITDLSATELRSIHLSLATSPGGQIGDGAIDRVEFLGSDKNDDLRLVATAAGVQLRGIGPTLDVTGFENGDPFEIDGGPGLDNVFISSAAAAKLSTITTAGETASNHADSLSAGSFAVPASFDAGKSPASMAAGNLFGFGNFISNDLVIADLKQNAVLILPNAGNGAFLPAVQLPTGGKAPRSVALADFNSDSLPDIAVTNSASGNVSIFLNRGDGNFSAPALFAVGKLPGVLRAGDVTGDGEVDLVMTTAAGTITTLPGNGDGTFGSATKRSSGGINPSDLVLADFSGDGRLDIAVANAGSNQVALIRANPDFSFAAPVRTRVGFKPSALAVGDFDGDDRPDLAVVHGVSRFVSVLLNASSSTTAFSTHIRLTHPGKNGPLALAVGDLDANGTDDLVIANSAAGSVSAFLNLGRPAFRTPFTLDLDNLPPRKISTVLVADLNHDGRLDIATANVGTADVSVIARIVGQGVL